MPQSRIPSIDYQFGMRRLLPLLTALVVLATTSPAFAGPSWPTYHFDNTRAGHDPGGNGVLPSLLPPAQAWRTPDLDGAIYAQPIVVADRIVIATENDT